MVLFIYTTQKKKRRSLTTKYAAYHAAHWQNIKFNKVLQKATSEVCVVLGARIPRSTA